VIVQNVRRKVTSFGDLTLDHRLCLLPRTYSPLTTKLRPTLDWLCSVAHRADRCPRAMSREMSVTVVLLSMPPATELEVSVGRGQSGRTTMGLINDAIPMSATVRRERRMRSSLWKRRKGAGVSDGPSPIKARASKIRIRRL